MAKATLPPPTLTMSKTEARRFMLAQQQLWPARSLTGKAGVLQFIGRVGSIQFDPINIVGRNPDLVLQSRVADFDVNTLDEMLYEDRTLLDGWDKMASIHLTPDRPYFARRRAAMKAHHGQPDRPAMQVAPAVMEAIRERGPLSSIDLKAEKKIDWSWGPTSQIRASMEALFVMGELVVHHRVNNRRYFDLTDRWLPADLIAAADPNLTDEDYRDWHVLRRLGGLALADTRTSEYWYGIQGVKSPELAATLTRLVEQGKALAVEVEGVSRSPLFMQAANLPILQAVRDSSPPKTAAFIAPLDNVIWNRWLVAQIFGFEYVWEVYKPAVQRQYGYYVLPVLYGDHFVARLDPSFDKKTRTLTINNWWWEKNVRPDADMEAALLACLQAFVRFLNVSQLEMGEKIADDPTMQWVRQVRIQERGGE